MLEAWSKAEYTELLISILLLAGIVFGMGFVDVAAGQLAQGSLMSFTVPDPANPEGTPLNLVCDPLVSPASTALGRTYDFAYCYLDRSADHMIYVYRQLNKANRQVSKLTTFSYNLAIPLYLAAASIYKSPHAGLSFIPSLIGSGMDALATSIFIQVSQKMLLQFFQTQLFLWLLPLGLALRTFTFSKRLGGTLIAIAIGTAIVYPISIVFAAGVYGHFAKEIDLSGLPGELPNLQNTMVCSPFVQHFMWLGSIFWWFVKFSGPCATAMGGWWACMLAAYPSAQALYSAINAVFFLTSSQALYDYAFKVHADQLYNALADPTNPNNILNAVSHNVMITAVLSVFSIILTVSATRSLSIQLGGDSQFYGIYRLI